MIRRVMGGAARALVLCLALAATVFGATAARIWAFAGVDEAAPADAIIVLGASAAHGVPSPVFRARIDHGIELYREGYADTIIFTGGTYAGEPCSEAAAAARYARAAGVPAGAMALDETSRTTEENLENASAIMARRGLGSAIVVSDPLHMARAMAIARGLGIDAASSPTPATRFATLGTQLPFLAREAGLYIGYTVLAALGMT